MNRRIRETNAIVLRKVPYSDTSLVLNCLTPKFGRLDIIAKGARRIEKKRHPLFDLFNELSFFFIESHSGALHNIKNPEIIQSNLDIANIPENLKFALDSARFIITNTHFNMHTDRLYNSVKKMIYDLSKKKSEGEWFTFTKLVYLDEQGFLPQFYQSDSAKFANLLSQIFRFCESENEEKPKLSANYVLKLDQWVNKICSSHNLLDYEIKEK